MTGADRDSDPQRRARDWRLSWLQRVCDVAEPWEHGKVFKASRYPSYYDANVVWVEDDPGLSVDELIAVADDALSGLEHRRIDFEPVGFAQLERIGDAAEVTQAAGDIDDLWIAAG